MLKEFLIALSLSNLCFYNIILAFFYKNKFYLKDLPGTNQLLALILNELLIATLFWLAWRLVKKINNRYLTLFAKFIVCFLVLIFIYDLARDFKAYFNIKLFRVTLLVLLIVLLVLKKTTKVAKSFLLLTAPFIGIVFIQAFQGITIDLTKNTTPEIKQPVVVEENNLPKILWLIFDGMDYRIAFLDKPYNLEMPEFDKLRQQAFMALNAYPPAGETITSMPALIDGKMISQSRIGGFDKLKIRYKDTNEIFDWGSRPNVFTRAKELNATTAFVGEYLPYSRIIGKDLDFCDWFQYYPLYTSSNSVFANMYQQIKMLLIGPARHYVQRKEAYLGVQNHTKRLVSCFDYNLIMIHNPIPHYPYFYQQPWWDDRSPQGYTNALKLVDLSLGEIRHIMESQGIWESTNVIISADHGKRISYDGMEEKRVPFIVKLANQKEPIIYETSFNTIITQDLILAILQREVSTPDELVIYLRKNGRMIEPELNNN